MRRESILYQFPYIGEDHRSGYGLYCDVKFVMFTDTNTDGKEDVVIGAEYMTGAGPQGAIPHVKVRIYEDYGDCFTYNGYTGKWTESPGYVAAYGNPWPDSGNVLTCSISNGNEFYGNL